MTGSGLLGRVDKPSFPAGKYLIQDSFPLETTLERRLVSQAEWMFLEPALLRSGEREDGFRTTDALRGSGRRSPMISTPAKPVQTAYR